MSDEPLEGTLEALRDVAMQLYMVTGANRTLLQKKVLNRARQVLENHGKDATFLKLI